MSSTYRELFDEQQRDVIMLAMQARTSQLRSRLKACLRGESAKGVQTAERLEFDIRVLEAIMRTLAEESN